MKKYLHTVIVLAFFTSCINAQKDGKGQLIRVEQVNAIQPSSSLFKPDRKLLPYLKLVKTYAGLKRTPGANNENIIAGTRLADNSFTKSPQLFGEGMDPENGIPASAFIKDAKSRIALLTTELFPEKQRVIYPLKNSNGFLFEITLPINISSYKNSALGISWKATINNDGSFFIASILFGGRLGISGTEVEMMPETEYLKTKFIAYQHGRNSSQPIWLYNPASKTFLGRTVNGWSVKLTPVSFVDALGSSVPAGVNIDWDFTCFETYASGMEQPSYFGFRKGIINSGRRDEQAGAQMLEHRLQ